MTFVKRLIDFTIALQPSTGGAPSTAQSGDTINLTGFRATTKIIKAGGATKGQLSASIYGLTLSRMNQLSTLGLQVQLVPRNLITVKAGDAVSGMSVVFQGSINDAYADLQSSPEVAFRITAAIGGSASIITAAASSYPGSADVNVVMKDLANRMGLTFESSLPPTYLSKPILFRIILEPNADLRG